MNKYFILAVKSALKSKDNRHYYLGAVGIRSDGKIVKASNIPNQERNVKCHAETRLSRKLDIGSVVYVARTNKNGNIILNSKPCNGCMNHLKARGVKEIYYTVSENKYERIIL
jgi:tRNA(Arg) A34 adenosine deaminase TadA